MTVSVVIQRDIISIHPLVAYHDVQCVHGG